MGAKAPKLRSAVIFAGSKREAIALNLQPQTLFGRFPRALFMGLIVVVFLLPATLALNTTAPVGPSSERLVIRYNDGSYEILRRTPMTKILPATVALPGKTGEVRGNWFEVQTAAGEALYRRPMTPPNVRYVEYRSPDNPARLKREEAVVAERTFSVLVPARTDAAYLVFYGPADVTKHRAMPAMEVGRIVLR